MDLVTWVITKMRGQKVGDDAYGNVYYRSNRKRADGAREERWVVYKGEAEASKVPAEWHAWLHHTVDEPITAPTREWHLPHLANMTGTAAAYVPPGHDTRGGHRDKASGDYQPWTPNG
jgi:NADH:ubiquinone oxidoreductase subunit